MNNTTVIILCGGKGLRMRPLTLTKPKPLLVVGDKTVLEYIIANLKKNGIEKIILTVGYLREKIMRYFKDGKKFGITIEYLEEKEEQNTAGSILPLKGKINAYFVVMMGDQITNIDLNKMMKFHEENKGIATIAVKKKQFPLEYGIIEAEGNVVVGFKEKPVLENYINTAIYIFSPRILEFIKEKEDFAKDVFPRLLKEKEKIVIYPMEEEWIDIGRIKDYEELKKNPQRVEHMKMH